MPRVPKHHRVVALSLVNILGGLTDSNPFTGSVSSFQENKYAEQAIAIADQGNEYADLENEYADLENAIADLENGRCLIPG